MSHKYISFIKSTVRICGYVAAFISLSAGLVLLIVAEIIGVLEELGEKS